MSSEKSISTPPAPLVGPRMNISRAYAVMEAQGVDALVLGGGLNLYHATGYWPLTDRMGYPPSTFAILTRNAAQPPAIVLSSFTYYYQLSDADRANAFAIYQYTSPVGAEVPGVVPKAAPLNMFRDRGDVRMDKIETDRADVVQRAATEHGTWAGAKYALARAFKDLGLLNGKVAADCVAAQRLIADAAPQASVVDADDVLRRIRPVKSELEIRLMRQAASANVEAALAAVKAMRAGANYRELRQLFFTEAARRGNKGVFMVVDRVSADAFDAPFRDGQAFLIDAVSEANGYHGDYGRTVFMGEPSRPMAKATQTIGKAWDEVRHALKPGMTFSEISALGKATLKKLGGNYNVSFSPHSVGLYHTDHVGNAGAAAFREDTVLEKGMIISVDCPLLESGVGGSAHLEDLTLITQDGSEPIHDVGSQTIVL